MLENTSIFLLKYCWFCTWWSFTIIICWSSFAIILLQAHFYSLDHPILSFESLTFPIHYSILETFTFRKTVLFWWTIYFWAKECPRSVRTVHYTRDRLPSSRHEFSENFHFEIQRLFTLRRDGLPFVKRPFIFKWIFHSRRTVHFRDLEQTFIDLLRAF